jgi:hypothetical protein
MKFVEEVVLNLKELSYSVTQNERTDDEDYYNSHDWCRIDIGMVQFRWGKRHVANAFFSINGFEQLDVTSEVQLSTLEWLQLKEYAIRIWQNAGYEAYIMRHVSFFHRIAPTCRATNVRRVVDEYNVKAGRLPRRLRPEPKKVDKFCECGVNLTKEYGTWAEVCPTCAVNCQK